MVASFVLKNVFIEQPATYVGNIQCSPRFKRFGAFIFKKSFWLGGSWQMNVISFSLLYEDKEIGSNISIFEPSL